ncbi:MAG TPA: LuxR C-terminal-related transcriptional regulator [Anaerolineaceae bacterium]|jgi:DNA-binding CsgD family transcriptional regulator/N-acetylneuraminic acid mutarotase|nr:LuxR C-terminal-related transcriptional regulator [Anaerolineaceae bacterium]
MTEDTELSKRELDILRLVATGASNKEIAQDLFISPNTVKVHLRNIFAKIGATSRTEATLYAVRTGLVAGAPAQPAMEVEESTEAPALPEPVDRQPPPKITFWKRRSVVAAAVVLILTIFGLGSWQIWKINAPTETPGITTAPLAGMTIQPRWQPAAALPSPGSGLASAIYEQEVYLFAGQTEAGISGNVWAYHLREKTWSPCAAKPTPVRDAQAVLLSEHIYIPGGLAADGRPTAVLEVYDPRSDSWESLAPLPKPLSGYALAGLEGRLFVFGGWDGQNFSTDVYVYEPDSDRWDVRQSLSSGRSQASAISAGNKIFIIGGTRSGQSLTEVLVYYPAREENGEDPWETRTSLPAARTNAGAALIADGIYVVGGGEPPLLYLIADDRWTELELPPDNLGDGVTVQVWENLLHVFGGQVDDVPNDHHFTYQAIYTLTLPVINR